MRNIAKALVAIIAIAGIAVATCEGIEVLTLDDGIEVLSCSADGIEVLAQDGIEVLGAYFVATVDGNVVDMCPVDPITRTGTVQFLIELREGCHIGLMSPQATSAPVSASGYVGGLEFD